MFKKTLQLITVLAIITIILLLSVIFMQTYINGMIKNPGGDKTDVTITDVTYLKSGMAVITGKNGKDGFYEIYGSDSKLINEGILSYMETDIDIHDTAPTENGFTVICMAKSPQKSAGTSGSYGIVYVYDLKENRLKKIEMPLLPGKDDYTYHISNGKYFASSKKKVYVFDADNQTYSEIALSNVYKVQDICFLNGNTYVIGQKAANATLTESKNAFYAAYDSEGGLLWEYNIMEEYKSTLIEIYPDKNGNLVMIGQYTENPEYEFLQAKNPSMPHVNEDKISSFVLYSDKDGELISSNIYKNEDNIYINDITGISEYNRIMTAGSYTRDITSGLYVINVNLINKEMIHMSGLYFESGTEVLYYITGSEDIGIYVGIHINGTNNYRLKHYASTGEFIAEMKLFCTLSESVKYITEHRLSIIFAYFAITACYVLKIKHPWRNIREKTD